MENKYFTVDRIEGSFAVLECPDGSFSDISLDLLPSGTHERSVLYKDSLGSFKIDEAEAPRKKKAAFDLQEQIFNKNNK